MRAGAPYPISSVPKGATAVVVDPLDASRTQASGAWRFLLAPVAAASETPQGSQPSNAGSAELPPANPPTWGQVSVFRHRCIHYNSARWSICGCRVGRSALTHLAHTGELVVQIRVNEGGRLSLALLAHRQGHRDGVLSQASKAAKAAGVVRLVLHVSRRAYSALHRHRGTAPRSCRCAFPGASECNGSRFRNKGRQLGSGVLWAVQAQQ